MASRTIAIRIVVDSRNSVTDIDKVNDALNRFENRTKGATHLQSGLTNSFIKGNLAARAISVAYMAVRDSLQFAAREGINFQHEMLKISAITETAGVPLETLTNTIRTLANVNKQSQNVLAQTALEMGKLGLTGMQVEEALEGVAQLGRALDENLVETGKAVVSIMNAYGFAAKDAARISDQLAFTVKASALDINSFATAFSYVGGTAKAAGVSIEDLQGAMDVLSNSGIRASTIGTQLRRILTDLSNENSKASAILGGKTLKDYESLADALFDLGQKGLTASDYAAVFGRTASSVIKILVDQNAVVRDLSKATSEANGVTQQMADIMNTSLKSSIEGLKVAFGDLGIEIVQATEGPLKFFTDMASSAVKEITGLVKIFNTPASFTEMMQNAEYAKRFREEAEKIRYYSPQMNAVPDAYLAQHTRVFKDFTKAVQDRENIVGKLSEIIDKEQAVAYQLARSKGKATMPANLFTDQKELARLMNLPGMSPEKWSAALTEALRKSGVAKVVESDESVLNTLLPKPIDVEKRKRELEAIMEDFWSSYIDFSPLGKQRPQLGEGLFGPSPLDSYKLNEPFGMNFKPANTRKDRWDEIEKIYQFEKQQIELLIGSWQNLTEMPDHYAAALAKHSGALQAFSDGFEQMTQRMAENIYDMKNPFTALSSIVRETFKQIVTSLIQATIRLMIFKAVVGALGGVPGGASIGGQILGSAFPDFMKQATGGTREVNQPTLFMAGESGPETVSVSPRAKSSKGGQASIQVVIQGDVMDGEKFMEAVRMAETRLNRRRV